MYSRVDVSRTHCLGAVLAVSLVACMVVGMPLRQAISEWSYAFANPGQHASYDLSRDPKAGSPLPPHLREAVRSRKAPKTFVIIVSSCSSCSLNKIDSAKLPTRSGVEYALVGCGDPLPPGRDDIYEVLGTTPEAIEPLNPAWFPRVYAVDPAGLLLRIQLPSQDVASFIQGEQ